MHTNLAPIPVSPEPALSRVLLVDSNKGNRHLLSAQLITGLELQVDVAANAANAERLLADQAVSYFVAVANVQLKGAADGEIVDLIQRYSIPLITYSMNDNRELRDKIVSKMVLDYVVIRSRQHFEYVESMVDRIRRNYDISVLLVDSSTAFRFFISELLGNHRFNVVEVSSAEAAMAALEKNPQIKVVVTDSSETGIDGPALIEQIRLRYKPQNLAILGISSSDDPEISVELLKAGASDFIRKPFAAEEFYCRINQNIAILEHIEEIRNSMLRDYLTGVFNRRYLYEAGNQIYQNARRGNISMAVALIDADKFKSINDNYGHDIGDLVLQTIATSLRKSLRESDIVARFGGEEFVCIATGVEQDHIDQVFERVREAIEMQDIATPAGSIKVTVSIGVCSELHQSLDDMINTADQAMYAAKQTGRNKVVVR